LATPVFGVQTPRIMHTPPARNTSGAEAVKLAALAGLHLDPWQQLVLDHSLGEAATGLWSSFDVGVIVSRQNGKGSIVEARALAGLFLLDERLIIYSAHEFKTARECYRRVWDLIKGTPSFKKRVARTVNNTFEVAIELHSGARMVFVARSKGSGRGFTGDCVFLDEAFNLPESTIDALMPTLSARPNPQIWYLSSAPDQDLAPCLPLARLRARALSQNGLTPGDLSYFEWSIDPHDDDCRKDCTEHDDPESHESWAKANPALGYRLSLEHTQRERDGMSLKGFMRERLGVGNYPPLEAEGGWKVIDLETWGRLQDPDSIAVGRIAFAADATPGGAHAAIGVAGIREDGLMHREVIDHRPGTSWAVPRMVELIKRWDPAGIAIDPGGPAGPLLTDLRAAIAADEEWRDDEFERERVLNKIFEPSTRDVATATGSLISATGMHDGDTPRVRIIPHSGLDAAVAGAETKPLADAVKWNRLAPYVDLSPLVAITIAGFALASAPEDVDVESWVMVGDL
jgi:hypothetical protein